MSVAISKEYNMPVIKSYDVLAYIKILSKIEDMCDGNICNHELSECDFYKTRNLKILAESLCLFKKYKTRDISERYGISTGCVYTVVKKELNNLKIIKNMLDKMSEYEIIYYLKNIEDRHKSEIRRRAKIANKKAQNKRNENFRIIKENRKKQSMINTYFYEIFTEEKILYLANMYLTNIKSGLGFDKIVSLMIEEIEKLINIQLTDAEKRLLITHIKCAVYKKMENK